MASDLVGGTNPGSSASQALLSRARALAGRPEKKSSKPRKASRAAVGVKCSACLARTCAAAMSPQMISE